MYKSVWYDNLTKPFLLPPAWVFSPVWIFMYAALLISIIVYSITITKKSKMSGYIWFIVHMVFNLLWSPVFFQLHKIKFAFFVVIIMCLSAILVITKFYSISKFAGLILIPYLAWLIFAAYLNFQILILN